jgi:hypothetical protein
MNRKYIAVANCSREFEGDIKNRGDRVKICGVGDINVFDYTKNTDMTNAAQQLNDNYRLILINQAKAFNFQIDDVERAQTNPKLMDAAVKNAASALANTADKYVFALCTKASLSIAETATIDNIISILIDARTKLFKTNVYDPSDIVIEVSPEVGNLILKAKINTSNEDTALETGCIGTIAGCKVFVSNNILVEDGIHKCMVRTKRSIAFAEQLSEMDAYRPEKRFADAVKGLHLYGAEVIYPNEMVRLDLTLSA